MFSLQNVSVLATVCSWDVREKRGRWEVGKKWSERSKEGERKRARGGERWWGWIQCMYVERQSSYFGDGRWQTGRGKKKREKDWEPSARRPRFCCLFGDSAPDRQDRTKWDAMVEMRRGAAASARGERY